MKIIHLPYTYFPDQSGGTEIYVTALCKELNRLGQEAIVAAPSSKTASYRHNGTMVHRYAIPDEVTDISQVYGRGQPLTISNFEKIVALEAPDIVHFHALSRGVTIELHRVAKQAGAGTVFTYHTPTVSCQRGTMLHKGITPCDGFLDVRRCTHCSLLKHRLPNPLSYFLSRIPPSMGKVVKRIQLPGKPATALRMTELISYQHETFRKLIDEVDYIVALCDWVKKMLLTNGVPKEKIVFSRHGISSEPIVHSRTSEDQKGSLRLALLGRLAPEKGIDVIIKALKSIETNRIQVDIFALYDSEDPYAEMIRRMADDDERIRFCNPVDHDKVRSTLRDYDLLLAPSQWLETGPLVVLEAFSVGVPVLGSNYGGIKELVKDGVNGYLIDPNTPHSWASRMQKLIEDPTVIDRFRGNIRVPPGMSDVAREMLHMYQSLIPNTSHRFD